MNIIPGAEVAKRVFTKETMGTFSGDVSLHRHFKDDNLSILDVNFSPCSRTYWHRHENGQLLEITSGSGWVCDKGDEPRRVEAGDIVWCPPGTVHWHGADKEDSMVHRAITYGIVEWYNPVSDDAPQEANQTV